MAAFRPIGSLDHNSHVTQPQSGSNQVHRPQPRRMKSMDETTDSSDMESRGRVPRYRKKQTLEKSRSTSAHDLRYRKSQPPELSLPKTHSSGALDNIGQGDDRLDQSQMSAKSDLAYSHNESVRSSASSVMPQPPPRRSRQAASQASLDSSTRSNGGLQLVSSYNMLRSDTGVNQPPSSRSSFHPTHSRLDSDSSSVSEIHDRRKLQSTKCIRWCIGRPSCFSTQFSEKFLSTTSRGYSNVGRTNPPRSCASPPSCS